MTVNKIISVQSVKFIISGGLATACHWLVMALLIFIGAKALTATAVGAFFGAVVNYYLQRNFTFKSQSAHYAVLLPYVFVCLQTWIINFVIFYLLHNIMLLITLYAQLLTTFVTTFLSYFLYKRNVFNDHKT